MSIGYGHVELLKKIIETNWDNPKEKKQFSMNEVLFLLQEMEEGAKYLEATGKDKHLLRGYKIFRKFIEQCVYRNAANFDTMILMVSAKGAGKSSSSIMMAKYWCHLLNIRFDPARHMAYTNGQVMEKIENLSPWEPLICLTGESKIIIKDQNGETKFEKIKKLVNMQNYEVMSYDKEKDNFEFIKPEKTVMTKYRAKVYELELENGYKIRATEDHQFLLKNGEYKKMIDLTDEDEIVLWSKKCIWCQKEFIPKNERTVSCCKKCQQKYEISKTINNQKYKEYHKNYEQQNKEKLYYRRKEYREKNKEIIKERKKKYREQNKEKIKTKQSKYFKENYERLKQNNKEWIKNNKKRYREYLNDRHKEKMKNDTNYKIRRNLKRRVSLALFNNGLFKEKSILKYIGCDIDFLKNHLEKQFKEGMTWENYGNKGWHIDHIIPCASFDLTDDDQAKKCFHYTNMQPLWWYDNLSKGVKTQ